MKKVLEIKIEKKTKTTDEQALCILCLLTRFNYLQFSYNSSSNFACLAAFTGSSTKLKTGR